MPFFVTLLALLGATLPAFGAIAPVCQNVNTAAYHGMVHAGTEYAMLPSHAVEGLLRHETHGAEAQRLLEAFEWIANQKNPPLLLLVPFTYPLPPRTVPRPRNR